MKTGGQRAIFVVMWLCDYNYVKYMFKYSFLKAKDCVFTYLTFISDDMVSATLATVDKKI